MGVSQCGMTSVIMVVVRWKALRTNVGMCVCVYLCYTMCVFVQRAAQGFSFDRPTAR